MKYLFRGLGFLLFAATLTSCGGSETLKAPQTTAIPEIPAIIPLPAQVSWEERAYAIPVENNICYSGEAQEAAQWIETLLSKAGFSVSANASANCGNWRIEQDSSLNATLGEEGYQLKISEEGVMLKAASKAGLFYGIQTLRQMFPAQIESEGLKGGVVLRHTSIEDKPEFGWRGTMVDVARSFFDLEYLKRHVDRMALYKMNRLHLHLSDDQGWRIEIKGWPKLTEIGGKSSVRRGRSGYLTQEEYKELQDYALERNITIIPEIDMPGHIYAALLSYPELNCDEYSNLTPKRAIPPAIFEDYNVGWSKFCLENPEIYKFVADVVEEMAEITKGPWLHIGGDEIEDPRYEEFVIKADSIVQSYGKTTIGWEEVTKAEVSSNLISQQWHGKVESVVKDIKVIHSLCSGLYLDHANEPGQENTNNWCKKDGVSLENTYNFDNYNPNVLGVEAAVWSEYVLTDEMMDNRFWPRAIAAAEVGWTKGSHRNYDDFAERLGKQGDRLRALDINFYRSPGVNWGVEKTVPGVFSNL
ncbi:beta-N-acetylhexosaminidase [Salinimicrobium tongyeongense]|uniref:beta-N-acetylhexosaminidase n=1 Tax=Salinimicrobium tongyeongense TaxID=2809707 RepID=A0ABY6NUS6_9FLAO|nr:beta-N-acetylhexosaminidase [Salinimicrobium tongyeongense]UZH56670.1 beta-N-acetylhexosaminidase [Salinimicrobium tongyeongense]